MRPVEQWIWLPKEVYPQYQTNCYSLEVAGSKEFKEYTVAALAREYDFHKPIASVSLRFSGDTYFALYCNKKHIATGPATGGGDFGELYREEALPQYYATSIELSQKEQAGVLHEAILNTLYDSDRKLFFEGLNTPTPEERVYFYMPQNVEKRYYRKHANILAAYFGFFDRETCQDLLCRIIEDDELGPVQVYFAHFLMEAIYRNGLCEKYTRQTLELWKEPVRDFEKGLPEGFYLPDETYTFDYSHGWGGSPAYALPQALSSLEIVEPGYKKIRLAPNLLGFEYADVQIPTPMGMIRLHMKAGEETQTELPEGVTLIQ